MIVRNHINDLQLSAEKMLLYHSDNVELKFFLKDLVEKLGYVKNILYIDAKLNLDIISEELEKIINKDKELTDVCINIHLKDSLEEKKEANIYFKLE